MSADVRGLLHLPSAAVPPRFRAGGCGDVPKRTRGWHLAPLAPLVSPLWRWNRAAGGTRCPRVDPTDLRRDFFETRTRSDGFRAKRARRASNVA